MTESLPMVAFLTAQYDAEQVDAENAEYGSMFFDTDGPAVTKHYQRWDGARVLADLAAKRELLKIWQRMDDHVSDDFATNSFADEILAQLLAPYGKRAVFTREGSSGPLSWHLEDDPAPRGES